MAHGPEAIPLARPFIPEESRREVLAVLESGYLTEGPVTRRLERAMAEFVGVRHAVAVCNGTVGLELGLRALGLEPGAEVIVPDYTYPATAQAARIAGARVVLVDVDPRTMLVDYEALGRAITDQTRAIVPVSLFGNPLDHDRLEQAIDGREIAIVEDAACALGASFQGQRVGVRAKLSVFSLHPRKFITTGEGGLVTATNDELVAWMRSYKRHGMQGDGVGPDTQFVRQGTNYKLSSLQAAVGLGQMVHIDRLLASRRALAARYCDLLDGLGGVELPEVTPGGEHWYQSFCVLVDRRDAVLESLRTQGIEVQIGWYALHRQPTFRDDPACRKAGELNGSASAFERCLALPLFEGLTEAQQKRVVEALARAISRP